MDKKPKHTIVVRIKVIADTREEAMEHVEQWMHDAGHEQADRIRAKGGDLSIRTPICHWQFK